MILIDTNILARYFLDDIQDHSERCRNLFERASLGHVNIFVPTTAIGELTWLLIKQKRIPKEVVIDLLLDLFQIRALTLENAEAVISALDLMRNTSGLSFVDCYHLALAKELGMTQIYTFDKKMDRYPGVEQIEP